MDIQKPQDMRVVVLGGGPAGLATAHGLTNAGVATIVLERNNFVGGLCVTVEKNGFKFDLGGHRWFTKNEDLNVWFRRLMEGEIVWVERISRIFHGGKYYGYPIQFSDVLKNCSSLTIAHAGWSYVWEQIRHTVAPRPIHNMHEAYRAQFGQKLYEMFFEQYSEKVWGLPCDEISGDWVSQRSKGLSVFTVAMNALRKSRTQAKSLIEEFMYPRDGYMRIPERMAEDIVNHGGDVRLKASVVAVEKTDGGYRVSYETDGTRHSVDCTHVVSTIPLGLLARILEPGCPAEVAEAAKRMRFRDIITVNLMLDRKQVSKDTWLYVQDRGIVFGRLHEPKNWSAAMVPNEDHTSLVLECFCNVGDHIWSMTDEELVERCVDDLAEKLGFVERSEVMDSLVIRARNAYPIYDLGYKENIATVMDYLSGFENLNVVGRGGSFRYNNADHSIEMGLILAQKLLGADIDHMDVNTEPEYQEIITEKLRRDRFAIANGNADEEKEEERKAPAFAAN